MKYRFYNPNPDSRRVGDCAVRALSKALGQDWETTYTGLCLQGFLMGDMPSSNKVWNSYIRRKGFYRHIIPNTCPDCYSVKDFCEDYPDGVYILALQGHVVTVVDGEYFDTWDSGDETPLYYFSREV